MIVGCLLSSPYKDLHNWDLEWKQQKVPKSPVHVRVNKIMDNYMFVFFFLLTDEAIGVGWFVFREWNKLEALLVINTLFGSKQVCGFMTRRILFSNHREFYVKQFPVVTAKLDFWSTQKWKPCRGKSNWVLW